MQGLNIKVERGQDQQQVLPLQFICQLSFPLQVCQMKMDIGVGNREQSFPTLQAWGMCLHLGISLFLANLQEKALSGSLSALKNLN